MPKVVNKEEKKQHILLAALRIFAQKGFHNTRINEIAREAGIGKGTIYEYFRSKEQIFAEGFKFLFSALENQLMHVLQSDLNPMEKLNLLVEKSFAEFTSFGEDFLEVMMHFWAESIRSKDPEMNTLIDLTPMYTKYRKIIAAIIQEGIDKNIFKPVRANLEASILMAAMDGIMLQWVLDKNAFTIEEIKTAIKIHFEHAIKRTD